MVQVLEKEKEKEQGRRTLAQEASDPAWPGLTANLNSRVLPQKRQTLRGGGVTRPWRTIHPKARAIEVTWLPVGARRECVGLASVQQSGLGLGPTASGPLGVKLLSVGLPASAGSTVDDRLGSERKSCF